MAMFSKIIIRTTTNGSSPLMNYKNIAEQYTFRYRSSSCGDNKTSTASLPLIGCSKNPTLYDCRKYSHNLPDNNIRPCFELIPNIPTGIFRCTEGEVLGLGAGKNCCYQTPEYFSFHHMSYYDIAYHLTPIRCPPPDTQRKPP